MSFPETAILPGGSFDQLNRLIGLLDRAEGRVRRQFLRLVRDTNALSDLESIASLLQTGDIQGALAIADEIAPNLATTLDQVYTASGLNSAEFLRSRVDTLFDFNTTNARSVQALQQTRLRLVREFTVGQRQATQEFLQDAFRRGLSPIEQARELQQSIGLTRHQAKSVTNFRRMLENRDPQILTRTLRDRRFDASIRRSIRTGVPLTPQQIDRQVGRYRDRWVRHRADTIARTETLAAASAADEELFQQAIDAGVIEADQLVNTWRARLRNTRDSHLSPLNGQTRRIGEPFRSNAGVRLRFPGDPSAPAAERINCQCVVQRDIIGGRASPAPIAA